MQRTTRNLIIVGAVAFFVGGGLAAAAKPPAPEPTVVVQTPEPVVQPTPQVITKEVPGPVQVERVEVTPPACRELITALSEVGGAQSSLLLDLYNAYLDYPNENLAQFGARAEALMSEANLPDFPANIDSLMNACLGDAGATLDGQEG